MRLKHSFKDVLGIISKELTIDEEGYAIQLMRNIESADRIFIAAAGRSKLIASMFAMRLMHLGYTVYIVGDVTTPAIAFGDLLLIVSGSGNTKQLVNFVKQAEEADIVLITTSRSSKIKEQNHNHLKYHEYYIGQERISSKGNLLPLGSRFELTTLIFLETVVINIMNARDISEENMKHKHANLE